jgi:hypothetical protein
MSTPISAQLTGTFTSTGVVENIALPSGYTEFEMTNITDMGSAGAITPVMKAWGTSSMADGSGIFATKTNGAATIAIPTTTTTNGFTFVDDSSTEAFGAANSTITAITNASPPVVSLTSTAGLQAGDDIILYGTTGALQLAGTVYTIDTIVANTTLNLAYVGTAPGSAATAGTLRRVPFHDSFLPAGRFITAITAATSAVVTLSVTHQFVAGMSVRFSIPDDWGMVEMDGLLGNITAVNTTTNTITVDIDSSGFTAFAYPSSATAGAGVEVAQVIPVGETANDTYANSLDDATNNQTFRGVIVGTSMQTTGKLYQWVARRGVVI